MKAPIDKTEPFTITIKNMVCPRCIDTVKRIVGSSGLPLIEVKLGEIHLGTRPSSKQKENLSKGLEENGFEIVQSAKARQINQIKTLIMNRVHYGEGSPELTLSSYLSQNINYDYSHLSKLFSSIEGITIERFATLQRIEKAKELLIYDEHSITEIANQLEYSSPAHLSAQFKRETGITPSKFRFQRTPIRQSIDSI
jgi:AraC family transcriptional regulator